MITRLLVVLLMVPLAVASWIVSLSSVSLSSGSPLLIVFSLLGSIGLVAYVVWRREELLFELDYTYYKQQKERSE